MAAWSDPASASRPPAGCRHHPAAQGEDGPAFATAEGLRAVLDRTHHAGAGAWDTDPDTARLIAFVSDRYAALARRHGRTPADAVAAAFITMQADATRTSVDPWAVVTTAVVRSLAAEARAEGLLTSAGRVRRHCHDAWHDAQRFGDHDVDLVDVLPALHHHDQPDVDRGAETDVAAIRVAAVVLFRCGWPLRLSMLLVDHICTRLLQAGSRQTAYEALRRDKTIRAHLDLTHDSWIAVLRAMLGHPTRSGPLAHGLFARLLTDATLEELLDDQDLVQLLTAQRPTPRVRVPR